MNLFDAFAVLLVVIAVLLGYRSGALPQVGGLIGALIGGGIAVLAVPLREDEARIGGGHRRPPPTFEDYPCRGGGTRNGW